MDRIEEAANVIIDINKYRKNLLADYELIKSVCGYFDLIKDQQLNHSDLIFLKHISNIAGVPHFYDILEKFNSKADIMGFDLNTFSSYFYEATLHTSESTKVHKYQKRVLDLFEKGKANRKFLSASTSFGKTHIVFEIIKKLEYDNIVLIFPTIALLSENLEKVITDTNYKELKDKYSIHTLSEVTEFGSKNLFIYTPERFLSFIEKDGNTTKFDFAFIDEVYKIDNDYIIDEEVKENERDVAYRLAVFYALKGDVDMLLAGPYIDFFKPNDPNYNSSFDQFLKTNKIDLIDFNNYEIVNKLFRNIKTASTVEIDENLIFSFDSTNKTQRLTQIVKLISDTQENTIVYCSSRSGVESYAKKLIDSTFFINYDHSGYLDFINHISMNFSDQWVLIRALKQGIGIHHGLIPKYIQKEVITLFNSGAIKTLISTTTITEGVNTSAKNLVVLHSKKGDKPLKKFDAKNIAGRAGRFLHHYSGRVIVLQNDFMNIIDSPPQPIKHKNYDVGSPKDDIDLFYTLNDFLTEGDKGRVNNILQEQTARAIPDYVIDHYKVVSRLDKIAVYDSIKTLSQAELQAINALIRKINYEMDIDSSGFQVILNVIYPIVRSSKLKWLIENKDKNGNFSVLTHFVHFYLDGGFKASMNYKITSQGKSIDEAIKETAEFVYNMLKYQVVKYLGVFNIMYKFHISTQTNKPFIDVSGIDRLLTKLEYNALTENGRIASDYGVPSKVVDYYEAVEGSENIKTGFDNYEASMFIRIDKIINKEND
jgi:hypothetical protein